MVIGLHGPAGVTAQYLVVTVNKEDKEHVINQNVEEKVAMAANTVPRPAILHAMINVRYTFLYVTTHWLTYYFNR